MVAIAFDNHKRSQGNSTGCLAVYTTFEDSNLNYSFGIIDVDSQTISWQSSGTISIDPISGISLNSVSMDNKGHFVVSYNDDSNNIYFVMGLLDTGYRGSNQEQNFSIPWSKCVQYDTGFGNRISMNNHGNFVEVHNGGSKLYYYLGKFDFANQTYHMGPSRLYDADYGASVGIDDQSRFVAVHNYSNNLYYRAGTLVF